VHVLGIDAGGTKTVCFLANEHGDVLGEGRAGGANLQTAGELEAEKVLHSVMEAAIGASGATPSVICLGIAGVDREDDASAVRSIMQRIGYKALTLVVNDALVALTAGVGDGAGVVIVAGTGSIAYGHDGKGWAARAGGWGYLLGDEGGGFWIGRRALAAVVRQADGRGPATRLTELVLAHLRLSRPSDLIHETYDRGPRRHVIASLAALVHQANTHGDAVAADILRDGAGELAIAAMSVVHQLNMRSEMFPFILGGGIFKAVPALTADLMHRLREVAPRSRAEVLNVEPALGAVRLALDEASGRTRLPVYVR
jgi:N-acetylglucosamine kinase-like BadF-type ATPase